MPDAGRTATAAPHESDLPGPFPVGSYAAQLKQRLLEFARVQLVGEVWGFRPSRSRVYFEVRDVRGAIPCSMWLSDYEALKMTLADGMRIIVGGGCKRRGERIDRASRQGHAPDVDRADGAAAGG